LFANCFDFSERKSWRSPEPSVLSMSDSGQSITEGLDIHG
jgi:hypothetical protein